MSELADIDVSFLGDLTHHAAREADRNLAIRFFSQPLQDEEASLREGRPIFADKDMIEIRVRGDRNNIVIREITQQDKIRFKAAYQDFKSDERKASRGTPLAQWPQISRSFAEELKYLGFYTVEDVAEATEISLMKVNGLREFKERAKLYLKQVSDMSPVNDLQAEKEKLLKQVEDQGTLIVQLQQQMEEMQKRLPKTRAPASKEE